MFSPYEIVRDLKGNRTYPAFSFLPEISRTTAHLSSCSRLAAINLINKSGYKGEEIQLYYFNLNEGPESANWLERQAKDIGINLTIKPIPDNNLIGEEILCNADLLLLSAILDTDTEFSLYTIYKSQHGFLR